MNSLRFNTITPTKHRPSNGKRLGNTLEDTHRDAVAYMDDSKRDPGRAGAGVHFLDASDSILEASSLPIEEVLLNDAPGNPAWQGHTIAGVKNSLRAEAVALRQAVRLWNDHARLVAFTDCTTALHTVIIYENEPHTMALHHRLPLTKDLARWKMPWQNLNTALSFNFKKEKRKNDHKTFSEAVRSMSTLLYKACGFKAHANQ